MATYNSRRRARDKRRSKYAGIIAQYERDKKRLAEITEFQGDFAQAIAELERRKPLAD